MMQLEFLIRRQVTTKWTITHYKTFNKINQIQQGFFLKLRMFLETPLIHSLTKERKVSPLCYSVHMTLNVGYPPPINNKIIKMPPSVFAMFRCLLKVEVYLENDYHVLKLLLINNMVNVLSFMQLLFSGTIFPFKFAMLVL